MKKHLIIYLLLVLFLCPDVASASAHRSCDLLCTIDSLLAVSPAINAAKENRIDMLRRRYDAARDDERRYWLARDLYEEYSTYDSDSAMRYAGVAMAKAATLGRKEWMDEARLNRAYVLSATGLLEAAGKCLDSVDVSRLGTDLTIKYCEQRLFVATHLYQYLNDKGLDEAYPKEIDSLLFATCSKLKPDDERYIWFLGWSHLKDAEAASKVIPEVKLAVDAQPMETREYAMNAWMLSKLYEYTHDDENRLNYLLRSAIADIKMSNKEIASLEEAGWLLFQQGDLEHARAFFDYSLACASDYKSRVRLARLASEQEQVAAAVQAHRAIRERQDSRHMLVLVALLVVAVVALAFSVWQTRKLRRSHRELARAKELEEARVAELQSTREELKLANERLSGLYDEARQSAMALQQVNDTKEKHIANIFTICSNYINKLDEFRKNIHRMIITRRFDEISELTKTPELSHGEIKELYATFDTIFLQIYPEFVEDFNTLLRPEERITPRPGQLNTELRIYALVRLGINDSVTIARFLHCSVQTVYNTRQRTRNKAVVPRDTFAETVKSLGKPAF